VRAEVLKDSRGGMWAWLFQRITAVLLFVGLATHLGATHIFAIGDLSYDNIADRLASGFFAAMDVVLLAAVLFHALNGVRMVVLDYWFTGRGARTWLAIVLWFVGLIAFVYGMWALWPWIKG
jgi:succinate dehydrogenase cytochrome b556 subunit